MSRLEGPAPAKLNLGLHVLRRRDDGYHDIDTVFVRIPWCDRVSVEPAATLTMTTDHPGLPVDERNLCIQAARRLRDQAGLQDGARIHLEKRIPFGAGLGGGSSDAATTLMLLARLWKVPASRVDLKAIALSVGSDVPFFLGPPVARGQGRGERLEPLPVPDLLRRGTLVVAVPPVAVSTAEAYRGVQASDTGRPSLPEVVASPRVERWRTALRNDFEETVSRMEPGIARALGLLADSGAGYAALSGSGSAVFGLYSSDSAARRAARILDADGCTTWTGRAGDPADALDG